METGRLGEYLLSRQVVNEQQLAAALEAQSSALSHRFLGDIFVEQQVLSKTDFDSHLTDYLQKKAEEAREEDLRLGSLMVDGGAITRKQLNDILEKQQDNPEAPPLGALLVEEGLISSWQLEVYLSNQKVMRKS